MKYSPVRKIVSESLNTLLWKKKKKKEVAFCFWLFPLSFGEQAKTHALVGLAH